MACPESRCAKASSAAERSFPADQDADSSPWDKDSWKKMDANTGDKANFIVKETAVL